MKILLACINLNGIAGSELYHYELARELKLLNNDVTLLTLRDIDVSDERRIILDNIGVKQVDLRSFNKEYKYDIIVASQPQSNYYLSEYCNFDCPIVSIIHSEIRSEEPIISPKIKHYISIRPFITDHLVKNYNIPSNMISLIYNPIDQTRYNTKGTVKHKKYTGIFVGEVLDNIREKAVRHVVASCIENDWNLILMSDSQIDFNHPNIRYVHKSWHTENEVKKCHFTAGILMGRTTLEGWCCGINGYMYIINENGDIVSIDTKKPENVVQLCNSRYVAQQHLDLYNLLTIR